MLQSSVPVVCKIPIGMPNIPGVPSQEIKMHVLFLSYDRNAGSCICLNLHLLMYFIIISHKNHCTGMSSQVTECGCVVILSNGL